MVLKLCDLYTTNVQFLKILLSNPPLPTLPLEGGRCEKIDLVLFHVIPAKAGIQCFQGLKN
jgi:hypothetical protein